MDAKPDPANWSSDEENIGITDGAPTQLNHRIADSGVLPENNSKPGNVVGGWGVKMYVLRIWGLNHI